MKSMVTDLRVSFHSGALSAIASAHLFYQVRKAATDQSSIPDWAIGLAEDVLILIGGKRLIDQLR